jgi:hypothetical protein
MPHTLVFFVEEILETIFGPYLSSTLVVGLLA